MQKSTAYLLAILLAIANSSHARTLPDFESDSSLDFCAAVELFDASVGARTDSGRIYGFKQFKRFESFWEPRVFPSGEFPDARKIYAETQNYFAKIEKCDSPLAVKWFSLGPNGKPENLLSYNSSGVGRINCVRFKPGSPNEIWAGSANGGVWKSIDGGESWRAMDFPDFMSIGVSDLRICPSNPNVIYTATGDADGWRLAGGFSIGVAKSTDGGESWAIAGPDANLADNLLISRLAVNPKNYEVLLAATSNGILKSDDGGDSWRKTAEGNFREILALDDDFREILCCRTSNIGKTAIFKSYDAGESWREVESFPDDYRIVLKTTPNDPDGVYAVVSDIATNGFGGFYFSPDRGESWILRSDEPNLLGIDPEGAESGGQGSYDLCLAASPENDEVVYVGGIHIWKSVDGGVTWEISTHWTGNYGLPFVHADSHDLEFSPDLGYLFSGNDGGVAFTSDGGESWNDISDGLEITQFYRISARKSYSGAIYGGTQDNGFNYRRGNLWKHSLGGDGTDCAVDCADPAIVYASNPFASLFVSTDSGVSFKPLFSENSADGERAAWTAPIVTHPVESKTVLVGCENVWKISNLGSKVERISFFDVDGSLHSLAVSPANPDYLLASKKNLLYFSKNGGVDWRKIRETKNFITSIVFDCENPEKFWISLGGYDPDEKILRFEGGEITNLSEGLPNLPINRVAVQKNTFERIFAASDAGVFLIDPGNDPVYLGSGTPRQIVTDLEIDEADGRIYAATFGRGVFSAMIDTCEKRVEKLLPDDDTIEICPGDSVLIKPENYFEEYRWSNGETRRVLTAKNAGKYFADVRSGFCKSRTDTIEIIVKDLPELNLSVSGESKLCEGDSLELEASKGFDNYQWNDGAIGRKRIIENPGVYYAEAEFDGCALKSEDLIVELAPKPDRPTIERVGNVLISSEAPEYQWYFDGEPVEGAVYREFAPSEQGIYFVEISNEFGCKNRSEPADFVAGVADTLPQGFCHSFSDGRLRVSIETNGSESFTVEIYNLLGNKVLSAYDLKSPTEINVSDLPRGAYYCKLSGDFGVKIFKFVSF